MTRLVPLGNRIALKELQRDKISPGGIHLPDNLQDISTSLRAEIVSLGMEVNKDIFRVGEIVIVRQYDTTEINKEFIVEADKILAKEVK